jgi:hypothetical protein
MVRRENIEAFRPQRGIREQIQRIRNRGFLQKKAATYKNKSRSLAVIASEIADGNAHEGPSNGFHLE